VLWVGDARRAADFYTRVVGLAPVRLDAFLAGEAPYPSVRVSGGSILDLVPAAGAPAAREYVGESRPSAAGHPINHVCLAMDRESMEGLAARLDAAGVARTARPERAYGARGWTRAWFYFQDPDGNVLEVRSYDDVG
jgi:catechol 2,3-dioxygenase-like lactoylglutathione lyase family enzyme